jgi:general secretion pathway protein K
MVLGTLAILTVMLIEFQDSTSAELGSSLAARDQVRAEYAAKSAVNLSRLLFASEPTIRKALSPLGQLTGMTFPQIPVWEYSDIILGPFSGEEGNEVFKAVSGMRLDGARNLGLDGAAFELKIIDEDAKINLNMGSKADSFSQQRMAEQILAMIGGAQYAEMFDLVDQEGEQHDVQTVCGALIDWADPNTDVNPCDPRAETNKSAGSEDGYYQLRDRAYRRKNAPYDSLDEVRLVRGIDDRFWQTFVQSDPDDPTTRNVTVWGSGSLNVNAATPLALLTLACHKAVPETPLCNDPEQAMQFISTLSLLKSFQQGMPIFTSPATFIAAIQGKGPVGKMMVGMGLTPVKLLSESEVQKAVGVESRVFSIYATGFVTSGKRRTSSRIHAVVDMRGAPPPGTAEDFAKLQQLKEAGFPGLSEEGEDAEKDNPYLSPNPGGTIVYYRLD